MIVIGLYGVLFESINERKNNRRPARIISLLEI